MEFPKPSEHHKVLDRLVGDWLYVTSSAVEGYDPEDPLKRWTEKVRTIGGANPSAGGRITLGGGLRNAAANAFHFYPDGTASAREIELRDRDGFGVLLRIHPTTARVDLVDLERRR